MISLSAFALTHLRGLSLYSFLFQVDHRVNHNEHLHWSYAADRQEHHVTGEIAEPTASALAKEIGSREDLIGMNIEIKTRNHIHLPGIPLHS